MTSLPTLTLPGYHASREYTGSEAEAFREAIRECAQEPIRTPGEVQPFGALLCVSCESNVVTRASGSCETVLGRSVRELLGRDIGEVFDLTALHDPNPLLADCDESDDPVTPHRKIGTLPVVGAAPEQIVEVMVHETDTERIVEVQPIRDGGVHGDDRPVAEDFIGAIGIGHETSAMQLDTLLRRAVKMIQRLSGFDRVMIYRFDESYNGAVVAEETTVGTEPFLGLHYPASDIPAQARELYLENRVRLLVEREYEGSPIYSLDPAAADPASFDMSRCMLRSMSPVHRHYLGNMGVNASLSLSIVCDGRLWGLVACHHMSPRPLSFGRLESFRQVANVLSMNVALLDNEHRKRSQQERFRVHQQILDTCQSEQSLLDGLSKRIEQLALLVEADGVALWFGDQVIRYGSCPKRDELEAIVSALDDHDLTEVYVAESINESLFGDEPAMDEPVISGPSAGLIAMQFWPSDMILLFRDEQSYNVRWGGKPVKTVSRDGEGRLQPRASFEEWVETVGGRSLPWTAADRNTASTFRSSLAVHIIRRSQELQELNRQLRSKTEEVEKFVYSVSHDMKAPLVTCQGFLGFLKDDLKAGDVDAASDSIRRVERAIATMNLFINDLLDFSRLGQDETAALGPIDMNEVVTEVLDRDQTQIDESGLDVQVLSPLPSVLGRRRDLERVVENLFSNAIKYASEVDPRVQIASRVEITHHCVSFRDFGPGIDEKYHAKALRLFQRVHTEKSGSGVGLAAVAKVLEMIGGRVELGSPDDGGLEVRLYFPVIADPSAKSRSRAAPAT